MTTTPQRVKRDTIVEALRRQILSGELPRRTWLRQDELARQFETSITPVREALRRLEAEGLLLSEPHRGVRVAGVDLEKVKGIYVLRRLAESYAMRRVISRLSRRDLTQARSMIERMEDDSHTGDFGALRTDNRSFHFFFYERCGLPGLCEQIDGMWQAFPWDLMLDTPGRAQRSQAEHLAILRAVECGDEAAVAAATEDHIAHGFMAIAQRLSDNRQEPLLDPFDLDAD